MGRHLHFDCFSGVSGDMVLGALVDAGLPLANLVRELKRLKLAGYRLEQQQVHRGALHATKINVVIRQGFDRPLTLARIHRVLAASTLPAAVKEQSRAVFDRLAEAEGLAHRVAKKDVHFHEVGVIDSFIDVVGGVLGCHLLGVTQVTSSPVNVGAGTIRTAHGLLPVPGPAVAALAKGIPIYSDGPRCELATPTGMALLRTLASSFRPMPVLESAQVGYGAGDADPEGWPNVLRVFLADEQAAVIRPTDVVVQIETNLDDLTPQAYEHVMDQLFSVGALDVTLTPVIMKRSRPGVVVSCLAAPEKLDAVLEVLFLETTALGVRLQELARQVLARRFVAVKVPGGTVRMKVAAIGAGWEKAAPEYVDCKKIAGLTGRPLKDVMDDARLAYAQLTTRKGRVRS
ncbi:nickel pincer cofactor biosynthesis protein LarC [Nitrospira sp. NS4]|uniref:nickel pincer cofactor biosynthesis protein LarC n=1 Tax=Nitrospira sp. NS4 TaxID=3414498 RepID=UPI003C30B876